MPASSQALETIAAWAQGTMVDGRQTQLPAPFDLRRTRWPLLKRALEQRQIRVGTDGFLLLEDAIDPEFRSVLRDLVRAENRDRYIAMELLLAQSGLPANSGRAYDLLAFIRQARLHHAGAKEAP